jgi:hypothetical protein
LFLAKTELQNAADACALAASYALTGANAGQLEVAEAYGVEVGTRNRVNFQSANVNVPVNSAITFSQSLNGLYLPRLAITNPTEMKYARCTLTQGGLLTFLVQVANAVAGNTIGPQTVDATAVATLDPSITACAIPLGICYGGTGPNFGLTVGQWLGGREQPGSGWTGAFKWVEFPGFERTPDLRALLAGSGQCDLGELSAVDSHNGVISTLVEPWNWRFGVHRNSGQTVSPDFSGYAYTDAESALGGTATWPSGSNAYEDFKARRGAHAPWNAAPALTGSWSGSSAAEHAGGADRRLVTAPVIDCPGIGAGPGSGSSAVHGWACVLLLNPVSAPHDYWKLEFRGEAGDPLSGCVTSGLPGGGTGGPKVPGLVL